MPAISVVVPCYNGGKYLDQLTATLVAQTFRDFETIIVDDGSTDLVTRTKLAALDPSIHVIHQDNRRMAAARNTGIAAARSELLVFLDCDDQLEPAYLEEAFRGMEKAPAEVGFAFTHERIAGSRQGIERKYFNPFDQLFKNPLGYNMMVRKSAVNKVGGFDETMRDGYEDWEFNIRLIFAGYRGIEIPKPLFIYNASLDGMMMSHSSRRHAQIWRSIRRKHGELYRLPNLVRLFLKTRGERNEVSLLRVIVSLAMTSVLPDSWYSAIMHFCRSCKMARPQDHGTAAAGSAALGSGAPSVG